VRGPDGACGRASASRRRGRARFLETLALAARRDARALRPLCGCCSLGEIGRLCRARDERHGCLGSRYHFGSDPRLNHEFVVRNDVLADRSEVIFVSRFVTIPIAPRALPDRCQRRPIGLCVLGEFERYEGAGHHRGRGGLPGGGSQ